MWRFEFPYYWSELSVTVGGLRYSACKRLGFFSYWLIRWFHGPEKLEEMSANALLQRELIGRG